VSVKDNASGMLYAVLCDSRWRSEASAVPQFNASNGIHYITKLTLSSNGKIRANSSRSHPIQAGDACSPSHIRHTFS